MTTARLDQFVIVYNPRPPLGFFIISLGLVYVCSSVRAVSPLDQVLSQACFVRDSATANSTCSRVARQRRL
jgi:hypothetical protein